MKKNIAHIVVDLPVSGPFDYIVPTEMQGQIVEGMRVHISFNRRLMVGFVVGFQEKSMFERLNTIIALLDTAPVFDVQALELSLQISAHYGCSQGEALALQLPLGLRKKTKVRFQPEGFSQQGSAGINTISPKISLFHDLGRQESWPIVLERVKKVISGGENVLVLVSEVSMIKGVKSELLKGIADDKLVVDQNKGTQKQISENWCALKQKSGVVLIGTRSSVFAPFSPCGLIIVFDEDQPSFKSEQSPAYHARVVALMRACLTGSDLIFVSGCPSADIWYAAHRDQWELRFFENKAQSVLNIVDLTNYKPGRNAFLNAPLQTAVRTALENGKRVLIFMNRRGFSTMTRCNQCGFGFKCERCDIHLTYIESKKSLVCCRCNLKKTLPRVCPSCSGAYLRSTGVGVEKLFGEMSRYYSEASVSCYDSDGADIKQDSQIVIATQAILMSKQRLNFDVIIHIDFDAELYRFDYKSAGRTFALLMTLKQMAKETLWVQTSMRDNYCLLAAQKNDWDAYYKEELTLREDIGVTPFRQLVSVHMRGEKEDIVFEQCKILYQLLCDKNFDGIEFSDPYPDVRPKLRDQYRFVITLTALQAKKILTVLKPVLKEMKKKRGVIVTLNVDL